MELHPYLFCVIVEKTDNMVLKPGIIVYLPEDLFARIPCPNNEKPFGFSFSSQSKFKKPFQIDTSRFVPRTQPEVEANTQSKSRNDKNG